ncbi:hypothetical protein LX77_00574 [Gelidibacter algens]|uniref:TetR family transcriptional regulator n=1 Tax=Gelidibacter algens TaxID=49280 RepID=A0A327SFY8_9FLAO|nr:hypothetical protein [Gelidibacter algens]RAJ27999.1 hypothetical protein LX77_00574 [Gelidibacter algens]
MIYLLSNLKIAVPKKVFIKDPGSSNSGKIISKHNIFIIDEIGFNAFTFKKLGAKIESNESSIYHYFEIKHKLLVSLTTWYWGWEKYQLVLAPQN